MTEDDVIPCTPPTTGEIVAEVLRQRQQLVGEMGGGCHYRVSVDPLLGRRLNDAYRFEDGKRVTLAQRLLQIGGVVTVAVVHAQADPYPLFRGAMPKGGVLVEPLP